jgi:hypothetical protein
MDAWRAGVEERRVLRGGRTAGNNDGASYLWWLRAVEEARRILIHNLSSVPSRSFYS